MLDAPRVTESVAQIAAVIHLTIPREEMRNVVGPCVAELMGALSAQGITPVGPLFAHHLRMDSGVFDFELGVPVSRPVTAAGRVQPGQLPAARVAQVIYRGDYEGLHDAWGEFHTWISEQGYTEGADLWERYLSGPESSSDPADFRTELNRPLI